LSKAAAQGGGRYLIAAPEAWSWLGYQTRTSQKDAGLLPDQQSMAIGLEEAQGYNSIQLVRYWEFNRAVDPKRMKYNAAGFVMAEPLALDLLQVDHVIQAADRALPLPGARVVAREGRWELVALPAAPPRASLVGSREVAESADAALRAVTVPGFDPERTAIVESNPNLPSSPGSTTPPAGLASFRWTGPSSAVVTVDARGPAIVLVRNTFDQHWRATVDGTSAPVLATDFLDQGVAVPAGHHVIELRYVDRSIGYGLAGSCASLAVLFALAVVLSRRRRRAAAAPSATSAATEPATPSPTVESA
jgi:hypothetical protein